MDDDLRATPEMRVILAELRLAQDDPAGAAAAVAPIVDGALDVRAPLFEIQALLLEAIAATRCAILLRRRGRWSGRSISPSPTVYWPCS
jgi:hypothetical protein